MPFSPYTVLKGVHILVIDDEPDSLALTTFVLASVGAAVTAVNCVAAAQTRFLAHPPQLVVSDLVMLGVAGYDFMAWVRTLSPADGGQVPTLALTALARLQDCQQSLQAGSMPT